MQPSSEQPDTASMLGIREVGVMLARHWGYTEGLYEVVVGFRFAAGAAGPNMGDVLPSGIMGISGVGLRKVEKPGPLVIDLAEVTPESPPKRAARAKRAPA